MVYKLKKTLANHFKEVVALKTSPSSIAAGFAVGTFIAILPTFGLGLLIGLVVIAIFKRISKVSMIGAFAVWNPLILTFLYPISYNIGNALLKNYPVTKFRIEILNTLFVYTGRFLLGSVILAISISIISYVIIYYLTKEYQKRESSKVQNP